MLPFAYLKCVATKFQLVMKANTILDKIKELFFVMCFVVAGIPLLLVGNLADSFYFWANNFRTQLKEIIITRVKSSITNETIRQFTNFCAKYNED